MVDVGTARTPAFVPLEIIGKSAKIIYLVFRTALWPFKLLVPLLDLGCMTFSVELFIYSLCEGNFGLGMKLFKLFIF